jgi:hypothetical protein
MKFESEKDILALQGKSRQERAVLRRTAYERDRSIVWISALGGALLAPFLPLAYWLLRHFTSDPGWIPFIGLYLLFAIPFTILFRRLFIVPRIRRALDLHEEPAA